MKGLIQHPAVELAQPVIRNCFDERDRYECQRCHEIGNRERSDQSIGWSALLSALEQDNDYQEVTNHPNKSKNKLQNCGVVPIKRIPRPRNIFRKLHFIAIVTRLKRRRGRSHFIAFNVVIVKQNYVRFYYLLQDRNHGTRRNFFIRATSGHRFDTFSRDVALVVIEERREYRVVTSNDVRRCWVRHPVRRLHGVGCLNEDRRRQTDKEPKTHTWSHDLQDYSACIKI